MDRAEQLRRKIALYPPIPEGRRGGARAATYLREMNRMETELDEIEGDSDKQD